MAEKIQKRQATKQVELTIGLREVVEALVLRHLVAEGFVQHLKAEELRVNHEEIIDWAVQNGVVSKDDIIPF